MTRRWRKPDSNRRSRFCERLSAVGPSAMPTRASEATSGQVEMVMVPKVPSCSPSVRDGRVRIRLPPAKSLKTIGTSAMRLGSKNGYVLMRFARRRVDDHQLAPLGRRSG
jgi:hypothetical protein